MTTSEITANAKQKGLPLFILALAIACFLAFTASEAFAKNGKDGGFSMGGGYSGPGPAVVTAEQAKSMADDTWVALKGHIIQSLGGKDYIFKDESGTVNVEIGKKRWQGLTIGPDDLVEIHGKVDKEWSTVEIEVKQIIKL